MRTLKYALCGAAVCGTAVTIFAFGEMLGSPDAPATPVLILLAVAMGGLPAAIVGAGVGGLVGLLTRERAAPATVREPVPQYSTPAPAPVPITAAPAPPTLSQQPPPPSRYAGAVGERLGIEGTVAKCYTYRETFATQEVRFETLLRDDAGRLIRWLANRDPGLTIGERIYLDAEVKEWNFEPGTAGMPDEPRTDVWYGRCKRLKPLSDRAAADAAAPAQEPEVPKATSMSSEKFAELRATMAAREEERAEKAEQERAERIAKEQAKKQATKLAPVKPAPTPPQASQVDLHDPERLNKILDELDALPGLETVAEQVRDLAYRVQVDQARREQGLPVADVGMHAVFVGPSGTGKNTVARIWGRMLAATGLLPKGHLIETDRSGLVGQWVGETAQKTSKVIDSAIGGVLLVDEAYALTPDGPASNDTGREVIEVLLKRMEDQRTEFCVIVAGYPDDMERFLDSNAGLRSRFAQTVTFPTYDAHTLLTILKSMADEKEYVFSPDAQALLAKALHRLVATPPPKFGNARAMVRVLDSTIMVQSKRIMTTDGLDGADLKTLTRDDIQTTLQAKYPQVL